MERCRMARWYKGARWLEQRLFLGRGKERRKKKMGRKKKWNAWEAEQRWGRPIHKVFPSGTIEAAPSKKPEEGEDDNGAKEASGYKPQLEPAPYGKFGAAPPKEGSSAYEPVPYGTFGAAPPKKGSSAEEANDPKGAIKPQEHKTVVTKSATGPGWGNWDTFL